MKRLLVLLCAVSILAIFTASPLMAARPSLGSRIQSILAMINQNVFPFSGSFYMVVDEELVAGDYRGFILGGDADDLANGRANGEPVLDPKTPTRTLRADGVQEQRTPENGIIRQAE